jgi:hypothetical protein
MNGLFAQADNIDKAHLSMREISLIEEPKDSLVKIRLAGEFVTALVQGEDTIIVADLAGVNISSPRTFASSDDYIKYMRYKAYAAKVYPFAKEAIRIFREAEYVSETMKKRKRKKYLKALSKELEDEFSAPLKNLSKTQGKILVEMIEKELEMPMFDLIKMTQGNLKAFYWNQSSKLYGYRLKNVYEKGDNKILDMVLDDLDISYQVEKTVVIDKK